MEARRLRSPGEFAEAEDQLFLEVVGEVVLCAEEDDATLGDFYG